LKEVPIDGVQSESIADRESMDTPKSIVQNSDVAKDTVISAPEPVAAVSPDVTSTSLEPIKKHDAGIKTPAVVASSTPALNSSTNAIATQSDNTQLNDIQVATNPEKNTSPVK
jgi:hypothetical protein